VNRTNSKLGLDLDRVVLLGRTLEEYARAFGFEPDALRGLRILDIGSGVSSFCAEGKDRGLDICALDPIYAWPADAIEKKCGPDLDQVVREIGGLSVYRWGFYKNPEEMRRYRTAAYNKFLSDYQPDSACYRPGQLPHLPFEDRSFDLALVSYLLFVYQEHLSYSFHRDSLAEIMRVTAGEARIYPTVTFEGEKSNYLAQLAADPAMAHYEFSEVKTDFEFLQSSNSFLRIRHRAQAG
jgi:hypothetical protein